MSITIKIEIDGKEVVNQKIEETKDKTMTYSQYARFFDESNPNWVKNSGLREKDGPVMNLFYLLRMQDHANELLRSRYSEHKVGHLYLNEVYEMLDMPTTVEGQFVGWIFSDHNPIGDNYVDFGIYNIDENAEFVNGYKNSILLDFNVDGVIVDRLYK